MQVLEFVVSTLFLKLQKRVFVDSNKMPTQLTKAKDDSIIIRVAVLNECDFLGLSPNVTDADLMKCVPM